MKCWLNTLIPIKGCRWEELTLQVVNVHRAGAAAILSPISVAGHVTVPFERNLFERELFVAMAFYIASENHSKF